MKWSLRKSYLAPPLAAGFRGRRREPAASGGAKWALFLCAIILTGCASKAENAAQRAVSDYFAGDCAAAVDRLQPLADKTDENFALNNLRLGSAELCEHDYDDAQAAFLKAYEVLNSFGTNNGGRTLGAVLVDEKMKIWRGEPYERAMANFYLGLTYYMQQDYQNARGAFENALFKLRDYADNAKEKKDDYKEVESNFAVAALMLGKCWQKLDRPDLAHANFDRAVQLQPRLHDIADYDRNLKSNLLIVIDYGYGPRKVADPYGSIIGFEPTPRTAAPLPQARVSIDGKLANVGPNLDLGAPTIDTVAMAADRHWQSIDTIRTIKSVLGTGLVAAGGIEGVRGANERGSAQRRDLTTGLALAGAGLLLKATSQADVRQWEMVPRTIYVVPLHVEAGTHDIEIDFGIPGLHQILRGIKVPDAKTDSKTDGGEVTCLVRMDRAYEPVRVREYRRYRGPR